jgi:hypothetical protein
MDKTDFLAIMNLALTDLKVVEPETVGVVMLALHKAPDGSLTVQFGSNIDQGLVAEALYALRDGDLKAHRHKRKIT